MRYPLLAAICAATLAVSAIAIATAAPPAAAASTCSDSWGVDGHSGPWYYAPSTLHGNTLVITCPSSTTAWSVHYMVCKAPAYVCQDYPIDETRSGHGSTSFSISVNPVGCNVGWDYYSHVHNIITGGNIWKPAQNTDHVIC